MEGNKEMGFWEFEEEICNHEGLQLRRIDPQTYQVLNSKREKIGVSKSREGYFPSLQEDVK